MRRFSALALAGVMMLLFVTVAVAGDHGKLVSVSNPYANCKIGPDIFGGVNYADTEPEAWLAANPANPDNLVGSFQQDRWDDGGAKGLVAGWTFDRGKKWGVTALPFSKCAAPYYHDAVLPYDRATDPWTSIGPDGRAYSVTVSFNANDNNNAVGAATSVDGGKTWQNIREIIHDVDSDPAFPFNDKETVTADPTHPGYAYAVWDRLVNVACGPRATPRTRKEQERGGDANAAATTCFEGPTYFSRTTNGGASWETPRVIVGNAPDEQTIGNEIVVDPRTGTLYNFYVYFPNVAPFTPQLRMIFSSDRGLTWSSQQFINTLEAVGITDPQTGAPARTGDIIPQPAIDNRTGQLYLVWQDGRFNANGQDDTLISTSVGGGLTGTWTAPQQVNLPQDRAGFTMSIAVNSLGNVGVDYYSMRHKDDGPDNWPIDRYLRVTGGPAVVTSTSGGPVASFSFGKPTHEAGPFNHLAAPDAGGVFLGDYEGLAVDGAGLAFHPFYLATNCENLKCAAVGTPAPDQGTVQTTTPKKDPMDVYSDVFFKDGSP